MADNVSKELRIANDADLVEAGFQIASEAANDTRLNNLEKIRALNISSQISTRFSNQRVREVQLGARLGMRSEDALKRLGYSSED